MLWPQQGVATQKQTPPWFQTSFNKTHVLWGRALLLSCLNAPQTHSLDEGGGSLLRGVWTQKCLYTYLFSVGREVPGVQEVHLVGGFFGIGSLGYSGSVARMHHGMVQDGTHVTGLGAVMGIGLSGTYDWFESGNDFPVSMFVSFRGFA